MTTNRKPKLISLRSGDRLTRQIMRKAHDAGRHGTDRAPLDVLEYWAAVCADCNARHYYEIVVGL